MALGKFPPEFLLANSHRVNFHPENSHLIKFPLDEFPPGEFQSGEIPPAAVSLANFTLEYSFPVQKWTGITNLQKLSAFIIAKMFYFYKWNVLKLICKYSFLRVI